MGLRIFWTHTHVWRDVWSNAEFIEQRCRRCKARRSIVVVHAAGWKPDEPSFGQVPHVVRSVPALPRQPGECQPPMRPVPPSAMDYERL